MSTERKVKLGIVGAGWWPNTMHMPALVGFGDVEVVAVCDVNRDLAQAMADKYGIPEVFTDYRQLIGSGLCEALIVATSNDTHHPIVMAALGAGLHVLCEKPLALNFAEASEMALTAQEKGLITYMPFTYRHMPSTRYLKHLIDSGSLGRLYHMQMRYYAGFAREGGGYLWRFDKKHGGSGALADIGSHFLHLAEWLCGEIEAVCAQLSVYIDRAPVDPQGQPYEQADDSAMVMLRFKNGAQGLVHASAVAYERTYEPTFEREGYSFDQVHEFDFHGSEGTLRQVIDWDYRQTITADSPGDGPERVLEIPDEFWGDARRDVVIETWQDVFRKEGRMVHEFVRAVARGEQVEPSFAEGARTQQLLDAAILSAETGRWVDTPRMDVTRPALASD